MRFERTNVSILLCSVLAVSVFGQQTSTSSVQASTLLQQSNAALTGGTRISDVTLSGSARRIAGSDDETGTVTLKGIASGAVRLDFSFASGTRSELRGDPASGFAGQWSGSDGISHSMANHNLINDWSWFPDFAIANFITSQNSVLTFVGNEIRNGQSVIHVTASQLFPDRSGNAAALIQHLSQIDFYLDTATHLPASIAYNIHPDNNGSVDIPVELHFSSYTAVNSAQVPFHIQKFINNTLALDLQFQSATLNSGLTASSFSIQ